MRTNVQNRGLFGDVLASGLLVGATALINFASLFLFARRLDPEAFGLFSTCRRVVAFVAPFVSLGLHLGVPRYVGFYAKEAQRRSAVVALGIGLTALVLPVTAVVFLALDRFGGHVGWIASLDARLWIGTAAYAAATGAGLIVFSIVRGYGHSQRANTHQLVTLAALLGLGFAANRLSVANLLVGAAITSTVVNAVFLLWVLRDHRSEWVRPQRMDLRLATREVGGYSITRLADGPLQASLSLIGVVMAPAIGGLTLAGYVHIAQTLVRITEVLIVPLSVIFLPLVAQQVRAGRMQDVSRQAQIVYDTVVLLGGLLVAQGLVWGGPLLVASFGARYAPAVPFMLVTLPAVLPFLLFTSLRSFVDGYSVRPMNSLHLVVAAVTVVVASLVARQFGGGMGLSIAYGLGMAVLGLLTLLYARRHFDLRLWSRNTALAASFAALPAVAAWPIARSSATLPTWELVGVFAAFELSVMFVIGYVALRTEHATAVYAASRLQSMTTRRRDVAPLEAPVRVEVAVPSNVTAVEETVS